jgi:predicted HicB family RNase H-like nuclease
MSKEKAEAPPIKTAVRIPAELHRKIKMEAVAAGLSMEAHIIALLRSTR